MRKKLTLTIDEDVYNELQRLPRWVSVSEIASIFLRNVALESKRSHMGEEDCMEAIDHIRDPRFFREILSERWGPTIYTVYEKMAMPHVESLPKAEKTGKKKKK